MSKRKTVLPSHMKKTIERVEEIASAMDLVFEVVDARAPNASRGPILTRILAGPHHVKVFSKLDLADPHATNQWKQHFKKQGHVFADLPFRQSIRAESFLSELGLPFFGEKGRMFKALVIGIPNVGKSTFINLLVGKKRAHTGARPGITRGLQLVRLDSGVFLYDTPGVINPVIKDEEQGHILGLIGCLQENMFDIQEAALYLVNRIISGGYTRLFENVYQTDPVETTDPLALLDALGRRRGCLQRGGGVNMERACSVLLRDFSTGRFSGLSLEIPESPDSE